MWESGQAESTTALSGKTGQTLVLSSSDVTPTKTYVFRVSYSNQWGISDKSAPQTYTVAGGGAGGGSYNFALAPSDTKLIVNTVFLPSLGTMSKASDLAAKMNAAPEASGAKVAKAVCWWDKSTGQPVVALFDDAGLVAGSADFPLTANECYQVYTTKAVTITLP
jgi:hypothetical protein